MKQGRKISIVSRMFAVLLAGMMVYSNRSMGIQGQGFRAFQPSGRCDIRKWTA